ncbi:MAG: anhydro-N-acetylmuramic acid kinase [Pseudomonadota bacterium]
MRALGLMSGTSMDGVDAAIVETDGESIFGFGETAFVPYSAPERKLLRSALGRWPRDPGLEEPESMIQARHAEAVASFKGVEAVGFHGQTLAHDPKGQGTHQIGRGDELSRETGHWTVWDFRTADVASGGEGAPLVPFFHFACAKWIKAKAPLAFLNLGGVGNVTWVNPAVSAPEDPKALLAFDTGPGNALIDDFMQARRGADFDPEGSVAASGKASNEVLADLEDHPYLRRPPPKSLDRQDFHGFLDRVAPLSTEDGAATLTELTAACVALAARHFPQPVERWIVCGGGRHNRTLLASLGRTTNTPVLTSEAVQLDGDMLEAQAFAFLAVRILRGLPTSSPTTTGCRLPVSGGRISSP